MDFPEKQQLSTFFGENLKNYCGIREKAGGKLWKNRETRWNTDVLEMCGFPQEKSLADIMEELNFYLRDRWEHLSLFLII